MYAKTETALVKRVIRAMALITLIKIAPKPVSGTTPDPKAILGTMKPAMISTRQNMVLSFMSDLLRVKPSVLYYVEILPKIILLSSGLLVYKKCPITHCH